MLDKISVRVKLYMLLLISGGSLFGLGIYGIADLKKMDENTHSLYADRVVPIEQLSTIGFEYAAIMVPLAQNVKDHKLTFQKAAEVLQKTKATINGNWQNYKRTYLTPVEASLVQETEQAKGIADKANETLLSILSKEDVQALDQFVQAQATADNDPFALSLGRLIALQVKIGKEIQNTNHETYIYTAKEFFLLVILFFVVALFLSSFIVRNIKELVCNISNHSKIIEESEERYRSLFEQASDAIYVINHKGDFRQVNDSMCNMVGYTRQELLQMNLEQLLNADLLQINPLQYNRVTPGTSIVGERQFVHKDGTIKNIEYNGKKFEDDRTLVIFRDITARKKMEAELRNAEIKFRTLADKSKVGIYIVQKGKFTYVNPRFAEVFGYEPDELIGIHPVEEIVHPEHRTIATEHVRARMEGEIESVHYEAKGIKKDGNANWVEFFGSSTVLEGEPTIIGSMIDITERKAAEEELRSSEQKYKLLFESNPVPLWMIAKDDLSIIAVNDTAANLYGYTKDELLHSGNNIVRHEDDMRLQGPHFETPVSGPADRGITRHFKKDGTVIFVNVIVNDILFEGREVRLVLTNDITEKLRAEEQLKKTEANLQTILNTTDTAYALLDRDLEILEFNTNALNFAKNEFKFDAEGGGKVFDLLPESRRGPFLQHIGEVFKGNTIGYEVNYGQSGGSDAWYHIRMFPLADKQNKILGLVLAITDITERKAAEQSLQSAYERIKTHIEFIRDIMWKQSHVLRSPLANLKGLIPVLRLDPSNEQIMAYIESELERMDAVFIEMAKDSSADKINF